MRFMIKLGGEQILGFPIIIQIAVQNFDLYFRRSINFVSLYGCGCGLLIGGKNVAHITSV